LDRYLSTLDVGRTTKNGYVRYMAKHVRPFVGHLKAGALDAEALDSLYGIITILAGKFRDHDPDRAADIAVDFLLGGIGRRESVASSEPSNVGRISQLSPTLTRAASGRPHATPARRGLGVRRFEWFASQLARVSQ
jgi:hypothetical protein